MEDEREEEEKREEKEDEEEREGEEEEGGAKHYGTSSWLALKWISFSSSQLHSKKKKKIKIFNEVSWKERGRFHSTGKKKFIPILSNFPMQESTSMFILSSLAVLNSKTELVSPVCPPSYDFNAFGREASRRLSNLN